MKPAIEKKINRHFVFIEAPIDLVGPQVILWGEATWWPKKCSMKFIRKTQGEIAVGTQFEQKVLLPMGPKWDVEVTKMTPNRSIERTFLNGMFLGKETVTTEGRLNGTRVDYMMEYEVRGLINRILWQFLFEKLHNKNIQMILLAFKEYAIRIEKDKTI